MLATLIPLFDKNMIVRSYSIVAQRDDLLRDAIKGSSGRWDSAMSVEGVEVLQSMGLKTLTDDREVFIPVSNVSLFTDIKGQGANKPEKVVLIIDHYVEPTEKYIERVKALRSQGFRFAAKNIPLNQVGDYKEIMDMMEYVFLNHHQVDIEKARRLFHTIFPNLKLVAEDVATPEEYEKLVGIGGFDYYEGEFFRIPKKGQDIELAPLKMTYLELIRIVNKPDFDLTTAADVIGKDPALVVELLKIVNRMTVNSGIKSIRNAAAMLGQEELKRWINTAVTKELCADRPSEITRLSMIRARFAELLAPVFGLESMSQELFMMGLFSVLDIVLQKPMAEVLETISLSKPITDALLTGEGQMAEVLNFIKAYEDASWMEVCRQMLLKDITMKDVYPVYLDALSWYRDLVSL